jgi:hypothetical protein
MVGNSGVWTYSQKHFVVMHIRKLKSAIFKRVLDILEGWIALADSCFNFLKGL